MPFSSKTTQESFRGRCVKRFYFTQQKVDTICLTEEKCATNASSPGGDASPRRHCQLGARCPKLAILELVIFMYLLVKASSLVKQMPTRGRVAPRLGRVPPIRLTNCSLSHIYPYVFRTFDLSFMFHFLL